MDDDLDSSLQVDPLFRALVANDGANLRGGQEFLPSRRLGAFLVISVALPDNIDSAILQIAEDLVGVFFVGTKNYGFGRIRKRPQSPVQPLETIGHPIFDAHGPNNRVEERLFRHRVSNVGRRRGSFLTAMVLWDFLYYWDHRWMHEVRLLWANHVTHHSSQRYNLSTALRQPWSGFLTFWVFAPMPLLGYASKTTMRAGQLNLLYQYWIHTEAIDRLPAAAEQVLNTPSHHRVHHGANQQYLDKNYGGILIVWDRLFGTFEPEVRRIKYGLTKNIKTYNPLRIAYHEMADIARDVRSAGNMRDRLGYVLRRPGWKPVAR